MSDELEPEDGEEDVTQDAEAGDKPDPEGLGDEAAPDMTAAGEAGAEQTDLEEIGEDGAEGISASQVDLLASVSDLDPPISGRRAAFMGVPIDVTVSIGRARPLVSELIKLQRDSVLTLDSKIEDPVELFIGERLIARGELQEMDDETGQLGVRLTEVADLSSGV